MAKNLGSGSPRCWSAGFRSREFYILTLKLVLPPGIQGKSRMRKRARTDLCGGRPAMVVPTATLPGGDIPNSDSFSQATFGITRRYWTLAFDVPPIGWIVGGSYIGPKRPSGKRRGITPHNSACDRSSMRSPLATGCILSTIRSVK